jgi:hypothetical protein
LLKSLFNYANCFRLILYFPVSALVTLFGNILQNPQDPRARADVRLMNLVVSFLSMLGSEEENGGVKRMLGVCSEFERIAKVVLDKQEKETSSRRKRKSHEDHNVKKQNGNQGTPQSRPPQMANGETPNIAGMFSPGLNNQMNIQQNGFGSSPMGNTGSPPSGEWQPEFGSDYTTPNAGMTPFADMGYTNGAQLNSPLTVNSFQQPFVPQDLWQMPMTLEWDWADMTGGIYPSFENGTMGDPSLHNANTQHLQHQPMQ